MLAEIIDVREKNCKDHPHIRLRSSPSGSRQPVRPIPRAWVAFRPVSSNAFVTRPVTWNERFQAYNENGEETNRFYRLFEDSVSLYLNNLEEGLAYQSMVELAWMWKNKALYSEKENWHYMIVHYKVPPERPKLHRNTKNDVIGKRRYGHGKNRQRPIGKSWKVLAECSRSFAQIYKTESNFKQSEQMQIYSNPFWRLYITPVRPQWRKTTYAPVWTRI